MTEHVFRLNAPFPPSGDQPQAIAQLVKGLNNNIRDHILLGVTGSGKTFSMANVIAQINRPTLVMAHNKTLAAQLCAEFKEFFPDNRVEYFVSYYDYYQPEAYIPHTDTFIEKDASINDEIDKLRHSATTALLERRDVIVVSSVSCIYGLGSPKEYGKHVFSVRAGMEIERDDLLRQLVNMQYERNDIEFGRGTFRVRGDVVEVIPISHSEESIRIEFFGNEIERITSVEIVSGKPIAKREHIAFFPASHFVASEDVLERAIRTIREELVVRLKELHSAGKLLEAQRLEQRTNYDLEMMQEMGFCSGIENYSRHLEGRAEGSTPSTLLDYFPDDYLLIVDESHVTIPQVGAMYGGDQSRKLNLIEHGFRLPSAADNRPLTFAEFESKMNQVVYVSATPGDYELNRSLNTAQQIIRPTGLLDPVIEVRPIMGQIDDLLAEMQTTIANKERVLITTLTKKMAEDLSIYLKEIGLKVRYLHSDIKTMERTAILRDLRNGVFDILIGINLLREGLDLPEVSLVAILDADKEGFLRSERSLIQTIGRAARNSEGRVLMYADRVTRSMRIAIDETERRRSIQQSYNEKHSITPTTIKKSVQKSLEASSLVEEDIEISNGIEKDLTHDEKISLRMKLEKEMKNAAKALDFELAAQLRDQLKALDEN